MTEAIATPADSEACLVCGEPLRSPRPAKCKFCNSAQGPPCVACGERLLDKSIRCNDCDTYQNLWSLENLWPLRLPPSTAFSILAKIITVLSILVPAWLWVYERNSDTEFKVTGAHHDQIYLKVWNTGRNPSTLTGFRLSFDRLPKEKMLVVDLDAGDKLQAKNVIQPGQFVTLVLKQPIQESLSSEMQAAQYTPAEVKALLEQKKTWEPLTFAVDVQESNDRDGTHETRTDHFPRERISDFLTATWGQKREQQTP